MCYKTFIKCYNIPTLKKAQKKREFNSRFFIYVLNLFFIIDCQILKSLT